jgi:hypothetical protein
LRWPRIAPASSQPPSRTLGLSAYLKSDEDSSCAEAASRLAASLDTRAAPGIGRLPRHLRWTRSFGPRTESRKRALCSGCFCI